MPHRAIATHVSLTANNVPVHLGKSYSICLARPKYSITDSRTAGFFTKEFDSRKFSTKFLLYTWTAESSTQNLLIARPFKMGFGTKCKAHDKFSTEIWTGKVLWSLYAEHYQLTATLVLPLSHAIENQKSDFITVLYSCIQIHPHIFTVISVFPDFGSNNVRVAQAWLSE
jgi:hypothetical protein